MNMRLSNQAVAFVFFFVCVGFQATSCAADENEKSGNKQVHKVLSGETVDIDLVAKCIQSVKSEVVVNNVDLSRMRLSLIQLMTPEQMKASKSADVKAALSAKSIAAILNDKMKIVRIVFSRDKVLPGGSVVFFCDLKTGKVLFVHRSR